MKGDVQIERPTHETVEVRCPKCRRSVTFNRVSDLQSTRPIAGMDETCTHSDCREPFWIHTDLCNPPYELLVADSIRLVQEKEYGASVIKLAMALESMLGLYLRVEMVYRPFAASSRPAYARELNTALSELHERSGKLGYTRLRNIALRHALALRRLPKVSLVVAEIQQLDTESGCPKDAELQAVKPQALSEYLLRLKALNVHELRNKIAHQKSYRPTRKEAERSLARARKVIAWASTVWGIDPGDDPDAYRFLDQGHLGRGSL